MSKFDEQLSRMKALCTYGTVNEQKKQSNSTLEYHMTGADGKEYGILKECSHYYIKSTTPDKKNIAESYNYIGGIANKKNFEYSSYNNALKNFELKLQSINEAHDSKVNTETLDPFKKEIIREGATDNMRNEIARQRQIMYNAAMIMNESSEYAVKGGPACSTKQPEAETGKKGDEGNKETKANPEFKGNHVGLDKKAVPFNENPKSVNEEVSATETDFDEGLKQTPEEPANIGWDMEGQEKPMNEESDDWGSRGLPSTPGVGEADTDHNNDPFNENPKAVNEDVDDDAELSSDDDDDVYDFSDEDLEFGDEEPTSDDVDDEDTFDGDEVSSEDDVEYPSSEDGAELGSDIDDVDDVDTRIADLEARIADLEAKLSDDLAVDSDDVDLTDDSEADADIDMSDDSVEGDDDVDMGDEDTFDGEDDIESDEDEDDEVFESKRNVMNRIVESVVRQMLKEDELHDFGKHPGYRKKPMTLPTTGEDKNEHGEDINDDSVHNEEPFGKEIGNGKPFAEKVIDAVTNDVMYRLTKGIPIDDGDKKKKRTNN